MCCKSGAKRFLSFPVISRGFCDAGAMAHRDRMKHLSHFVLLCINKKTTSHQSDMVSKCIKTCGKQFSGLRSTPPCKEAEGTLQRSISGGLKTHFAQTVSPVLPSIERFHLVAVSKSLRSKNRFLNLCRQA